MIVPVSYYDAADTFESMLKEARRRRAADVLMNLKECLVRLSAAAVAYEQASMRLSEENRTLDAEAVMHLRQAKHYNAEVFRLFEALSD